MIGSTYPTLRPDDMELAKLTPIGRHRASFLDIISSKQPMEKVLDARGITFPQSSMRAYLKDRTVRYLTMNLSTSSSGQG